VSVARKFEVRAKVANVTLAKAKSALRLLGDGRLRVQEEVTARWCWLRPGSTTG